MAALETTATLECNCLAAYDRRFGNRANTHMQESFDDAAATGDLRECKTFLLPSTLDTCVHKASSCFLETVKDNPRCNEILCYHAYLDCESWEGKSEIRVKPRCQTHSNDRHAVLLITMIERPGTSEDSKCHTRLNNVFNAKTHGNQSLHVKCLFANKK